MDTSRQIAEMLMMILTFGVMAGWLISGYIGAIWLAAKGYWLELVGCAILAGGIPCLLPAVVGPLFLVAAFLVPAKADSPLAGWGIGATKAKQVQD